MNTNKDINHLYLLQSSLINNAIHQKGDGIYKFQLSAYAFCNII